MRHSVRNYSDESLSFLKEFPHPSIYTSKSEDKIIEILKEKWDHLESWTISN